ncbi:MAG TPA: competence/damage-inducible protein A [Actinomycetota bacterium]|nr:competence/damage-inducible protein A [Actinomycetota bacterium]
MRAQIISVGTELLLGQIANTNAQVMSQWLAEVGVDVLFHVTVGDNEERLAGSLTEALQRSDVVIVTGGLGPTHDDLTREAISRATGRALIRDEQIELWLRELFMKLGREMPEMNLRQADVPIGAVSIPNPLGTAPGVDLTIDGTRIFAVPGVPAEMESMMRRWVLPALSKVTGAVIKSRIVRVVGLGESDVARRVSAIIEGLEGAGGATIAILASAGEVRLRITAKAPDEAAALMQIAPIEQELRTTLGRAVVGADDEVIEIVIGETMRSRGLTLAVAESFTGGMVASTLIGAPGASRFLEAGYICYSDEAKIRDVGVAPALIESDGSVSAAVAEAMASGARERADTDLGIATTGEAGPVASSDVQGHAFIALAWEGGSTARELRLPGDREAIRKRGSLAALDLLRLWLNGEISEK